MYENIFSIDSFVKGTLESEGPDSIVRVEDHLIHGKREDAISDAITSGDFATALIVASMCGPERYQSVAQQFIEKKFHTDSPLYTTASLFSGKFDAPSWGERPDDLIDNWKDNLAAIINNRTIGWDKLVLSLGDKLKEIGRIQESHFCYMVCGYPIESPTNKDTRLALLGCDHSSNRKNLTLSTNESLVAFERTEAYEWTKQQANPAACFSNFQAFKLIYAVHLVESHEITKAIEFISCIRFPTNIASSNISFSDGVSVSQMFEQSPALELACNELKYQLQSGLTKTEYAQILLNGGKMNVDKATIQRTAETRNTSVSGNHEGPPNSKSRSVLNREENHPSPGIESPNDATFLTAKTNLMDVTGYSLDETGNERSFVVDSKHAAKNISQSQSTIKSVTVNHYPSTGTNNPTKLTRRTSSVSTGIKMTTPQSQPSSTIIPPTNDTSKVENNSTPHLQQRPKSPPATAPPMMTGKIVEKPTPKTPAPASGNTIPKAPGSGMFGGMKSYLIKKVRMLVTCFLILYVDFSNQSSLFRSFLFFVLK